jgi:hypothetical protein
LTATNISLACALCSMMPLVVFKLTAFALQVCLLDQMLSSLTMFVRRRLTLFKMWISLTMKDPLTKYHLLKYCQHSRLEFLGRNVSPSQMTTPVNGIVGPQHVDWAVIQAILKVGTAGQFDTLQPDMQKWCKHVITLPYHL